MSDSGDDYDYREVPMPSDDEDDEIVQEVLAQLVQHAHAGRLSADALFQRYDQSGQGWNHKNFKEVARVVGVQLIESEAQSAFSALAHGGGDNSRISAETFHTAFRKAKRAAAQAQPRQSHLPHVERRRRDEVFAMANSRGGRPSDGFLDRRQVELAVTELFPGFQHAEITMLAFKTADTMNDGKIAQRDFRSLIEFVTYFNSKWDHFEELGRRDRITLEQFMRGCRDVLPRAISEREAEEEFNQKLDVNGDGEIPFVEFCRWAAARAVPGNDYESPKPRDGGRRTVEMRPRGPVLRETLKMQTMKGMRWETLFVVIDARPEEVQKEQFTFAVYSGEQGFADVSAHAIPTTT